MDGRDHHKFTWKIRYQGAILFVMGIPHSPYSYLAKKGVSIIKPTRFSKKDIEEDRITQAYIDLEFKYHNNYSYLPEFYYNLDNKL